MKNCYELTLELIRKFDDLQRTIDKKSIAPIEDQDWLETEINKLESEIFEIQNKLKSISV